MSAVMDTIYNNYLTTYTPKSITRFDTHKNSELRSIYNSIVKINKESPWYLPTTSSDTQQYAIELKEGARELRNTIAQLGGLDDNGLFDKKSAYSTDEDIAAVTYTGSENPDDKVPSFDLEVRSLASSQENLGLFLPADGQIGLPADTYSFDVAINDMNYEFQFSIGENETNIELQERLVRLINNSDIGIAASIAASEGRTSLRLTSDASGLSNDRTQIFTVTDDRTSKASGMVDYFGLDYTSRNASNASFLINGVENSSSSNSFSIGNLFEVQLKGISPTNEPVKIGLKTDIESLTDNVSYLIRGYNNFIQAASSYLDSQPRSGRLVKELSGIARLYSDSFDKTGLSVQDDGLINIDRKHLRQVVSESEDASQTFDYIRDFSVNLLRKSNQVSLNPMDYVERTIVAYKNPGHNFVNPYSTSAYSGMIFNGYC
ncbi:MAG: flagellar filament capping protein FliD [Lachnospiraceae bacterium]|nr:flagellar filament capping protein FliD [Lachnospiraceae bacterium]